jgi:hypothetical protein
VGGALLGSGVPDGPGWPGAGGVLDVGEVEGEGWPDAGRVGDAVGLGEVVGEGERVVCRGAGDRLGAGTVGTGDGIAWGAGGGTTVR